MYGEWRWFSAVVVVVVAWAGRCDGGVLDWLAWDIPQKDLCEEGCRCPKDVVLATERGIDCVGLNITYIHDGLDVPKVFPSISFARNHISSIYAKTFSPSTSLLSLDISENELTTLLGRVFKPLQVLSSLNLRNNIISTVEEEAFSGLQNLTKLDISYNRIRELPNDVFQDLTSLEELRMGFNPLETLNETLLQHTPALRFLDLSKLGLRSIPVNFFKANLTNLESVSLAYNKFKVVPTKPLHYLGPSLLHLDLSGNIITSIGAYSFDGLRNLRSLMLEQMLKLTSIGPYAFGDLTRLETITLRYMPVIMGLDAKAFRKTDNGSEFSLTLSDFTFSYSSLSTLPEDLLPWDDLHYISLQFNHWKCDCNMRWVKNSTFLLKQTGKRMMCHEPSNLRGYHLTHIKEKDLTCDPPPTSKTKGAFGFLVVIMIAGLSASLATVTMLVYWHRGWVCRNPDVTVYSRVLRTGSTITITEDMETTSEA